MDELLGALRSDPSNPSLLAEVEQTYRSGGNLRDLTRALEDLLKEANPDGDPTLDMLHEQLAELYAELGDLGLAAPHLERLLTRADVSEPVLSLAELALDVRTVGARIAPLLADAYTRLGRTGNEIATLKRELKLARPPRLNQVQLRLALLHRDVIDDGVGALELLDALVTRDASDDEARRALIETGHKLNQVDHAGRILERAARFVKDPAVRWRVTSDFAQLLLDSGDPKRAFREFSRIVTGATSSADPSVLAAAGALLRMADEQGAPLKLRAVAQAVLAEHEPDPERRLAEAQKLARLCEENTALDRMLARAAYRTLAASGDTAALDKLEALAEASNDVLAKADVLEQRARLCADPELARQLDFASSELRASAAESPAAALELWQAHARRHGGSRDLDARLLPLLEQAGDHAALAGLLEREAALTEDAVQRSVLFARAGQVALERLGDQARALGDFEQSLRASDAEPTARRGLLALTRDGQHRLTAARLLDPLLGRDVPSPALFDVLEARFTLEPDPAERFEALQAAVALAERSELAPRRQLELYGAGLPHVSQTEPERLSEWLDHMRTLAEGDLALRYAELVQLAAAADPTSPELLEAVDQLAEAASESLELRLGRWDAALAATQDERRVDALKHHRARLLAEIGDTEGAAAVWQEIIERHPSYAPAHEGLLAIYHAAGDVSAVYSELERALLHLDGYDRVRALWHMAQILEERGELTEALVRYGELLKLATFEEAGLQKIERLADELGDPEITCRVLEYRIEHSEDAEQRVELLERLGELRLERLGDEQGAIQSWKAGARLSDAPESRGRAQRLYERMVATMPNDREAAERLVSLYAEDGQWAKIPEALGVLLHAEDGAGVRVDLLLSLERQALAAGAAVEYLDLVDEALWQLGGREPEHARELLAAKARLLSGLPDKFEAAAEVYRTLVDTYGNPDDVLAFDAAIERTRDAALRRELSRWLFEWRSARADAPAEVLVPWAEREEREFGDARAAIGLYERALAHAPERKDLHERLARLKLAEGDVDGALEALRHRESAGATQDPSLELEFAKRLGAKFGRHDAALQLVAPYFEDGKPSPDAVDVALAALDDEDTRLRAAELLERAVETEGSERAAAILRRLLEAAERAEALSERRLAWFTRLSQLLGDAPGQSLAVAALAVEHFPNDEQCWNRAVELARQLANPQILVDAGSRALERRLDPDVADVLGRRLLEFVEDWSVNPGALSQILRRVLDLTPRSRWAFDRLKLLLTSQTRYDELFELYDQAVEAAPDDTARADVLDEAALVAKDVARDLDRSVGYLHALVELRPDDDRVRVALERQYERQGNRAGLAELLVKHAARTTGGDRAAVSARIARLYLELGRADSALEWIEPLIADHETDTSVHELLEQVAAAPLGEAEQPRASAPYRAATQLKRLYEISSAPSSVARQLERLLELVADHGERAELLAELVNLRLDALDDPAGALERLSELVLLEPRSSAHRVQLSELAARLTAHAARVELLERAAGDADAELALELFDEAARACREHLADEERAAQLYRRALEKNAGDAGGVERVAPILAELLERAGKSAEQCTVLEDLADKRRDAAARRDTRLAVARIALDRLGDGQRAARALAAILEHDAGDREALDLNVRALEHAADWSALVGALRGRAAHASRDEARRDWATAARLLAEPLLQMKDSIAAWRELQRDFGSDPESFGALSELLTKEQDWPELSALLEREIEAERDPIRRRELFFRLGEVHRDHTGDRAAALEAFASSGEWQLAIELVESASVPEAEREPLTAALFKRSIDAWKQGESPGSKKPAEAALWAAEQRAAQLSARGEPARAVQLLERSAKLPFDTRARRELGRLAAELHAEKLDNRAQAAAIFRELLEADPNDETAARCFEPFAAVLEQQGEKAALARLCSQQAELCLRAGAPDDARRHWERAGELWREQDVEKALTAYARAGELGSLSSLATMTEIHRARGEHARAARVLRKLYAAAGPDERAGYALELAEALGQSGEPEQARAALEEVAESGRATPLVRERLAALYRAAGALRPLAGLLVTDAEHEGTPARRAELLREAARLYDEIGEAERAVPLLERAREAAPDSPQVHCEIARVLCKTGQSAAAIALLRSRIETYGERRPRERALLHWELGRALVSQSLAAEGVDELRLASQIWPNHPGVMHELAERALEHGNLELAEATYRTLLLLLRQTEPAPAEAPGSSAVYLELAEIAQRTGDARQAEDLVESAFEAALRDDAEQQALERALAKRGQAALLRRALEDRLKRARSPLASSAALADLLDLARAQNDAALAEEVRQQADAAFSQLTEADPPEREALLALSGVYSKIGDDAAGKAATEIYERLFRHDPDDATIARTLSEAYGKSGQFAAWVELVDTSASRVTTSSEKSQLRTRAARAMLEYDSESSYATELLSQAALDDPDNDDCAALLSELLERQGDIEGLVELLGRRSEASSTPTERINTTLDLAALLARSGRSEDAWAAYYRILTADPSHKLALQGLIGLVDKVNVEPASVAGILEALIELETGEARAELSERLIQTYFAQENWTKLAAILQSSLVQQPHDGQRRRQLIDVLCKNDQPERALELIDAELEDNPADHELFRQRATLLEAMADYDGALAALERAQDLDATHTDALIAMLEAVIEGQKISDVSSAGLRLSALLKKQGRLEAAQVELTRVLERDPTERRALEQMGKLAATRQDWQTVLDTYRRLANLGESRVVTALAIANASERLGRPLDARADLELALERAPGHPEIVERLKRLYRSSGDEPKLAALLLSMSETAEGDARLTLRLEAAELLVKNPATAAQGSAVLEQVCAEQPENLHAAELLARLSLGQGRPEQARALLERVARAHKGTRSKPYARLLVELGNVCLAEDDLLGAYQALREATDIDRSNGPAQLLFGLVAVDVDDLARADAALRVVTLLKPGEAEGSVTAQQKSTAYFQLGSLARLHEDLAKARLMFKKALVEDPSNDRARRLLAEVSAN